MLLLLTSGRTVSMAFPKTPCVYFLTTFVRIGMCCKFGGSGWQAEKIVKHAVQPPIFKWRQTAPEFILCAVHWYLGIRCRCAMLKSCSPNAGLKADHTTIWRWAQRYGPELEQRLHRLL